VTKIIASHDLEFILETCRRVVILDAGRVVADGSARVLLSNPALMNDHGLEVPHSLTPHVSPHHRKGIE
jgi:cobalt/nickel transport system ATP-binding protein